MKKGVLTLAVLTLVALAPGSRAWSQGAAPVAAALRTAPFPASAADWPKYISDPADGGDNGLLRVPQADPKESREELSVLEDTP